MPMPASMINDHCEQTVAYVARSQPLADLLVGRAYAQISLPKKKTNTTITHTRRGYFDSPTDKTFGNIKK